MTNEQKRLLYLADLYTCEGGGAWPVVPQEFASWAVRVKGWKPTVDAVIRACAEQLSRAMREEYTTDRKGRRIRTKHAVCITRGSRQIWLWDDLRTAPRAHMVRAFQQRRDQIVGDCHQLKNDVDSYNEVHIDQPPLQLVLDFTLDMVELGQRNRRQAA